MIDMQYANFNDADKLIYFEAAINPSFNLLLTGELKTVEEQILQLDKREGESDAIFCRRFDALKANRTVVLAFIEINKKVIKEIQNLRT